MYNIYICLVENFKAVQFVGTAKSKVDGDLKGEDAMDGLNPMKYFPCVVGQDTNRDEELDNDLRKIAKAQKM